MNVFDKAVRFMFRRNRYDLGTTASIAGSVAVGVGLLYAFASPGGARRRALVRDKAQSALRRTDRLLDKSARDLRHRSQGALAEASAIFRNEEVSDDVLVDRVRSRLGRVVSHPHAIRVQAIDGSVTLAGPILAYEVDDLLSAVSAVRGVKSVSNQLEVHPSAAGIPSLQGSPRRRLGERSELMKESWTPIVRVIMGALGAGLVGYGVKRRDDLGLLCGACGAAVLLRDIMNRPFSRLFGLGGGRRAVDFEKTITVRAPIEEVFSFFSAFENLPRFMSHLHRVERHDGGISRWTAAGPVGIPVSWNAETIEFLQNEVIAWRSLPGEAIANGGIVRFEETPEGHTRLDIKMSYNPPAGALGHAVAALFGADPERAMDEDLVRLQSLLERGKTTAHGEQVRLSDLASQAAR